MSDDNKQHPISIIRADHGKENPYFQYLRTTAQDRTISFAARGVMAYLLSRNDNWKLQPKDLQQKCGKGKVYTLLNELIASQYIVRFEARDNKTKRVDHYKYVVYEKPLTEKQEAALPDAEKRDITYKRVVVVQKKEGTKKDSPPQAGGGDLSDFGDGLPGRVWKQIWDTTDNPTCAICLGYEIEMYVADIETDSGTETLCYDCKQSLHTGDGGKPVNASKCAVCGGGFDNGKVGGDSEIESMYGPTVCDGCYRWLQGNCQPDYPLRSEDTQIPTIDATKMEYGSIDDERKVQATKDMRGVTYTAQRNKSGNIVQKMRLCNCGVGFGDDKDYVAHTLYVAATGEQLAVCLLCNTFEILPNDEWIKGEWDKDEPALYCWADGCNGKIDSAYYTPNSHDLESFAILCPGCWLELTRSHTPGAPIDNTPLTEGERQHGIAAHESYIADESAKMAAPDPTCSACNEIIHDGHCLCDSESLPNVQQLDTYLAAALEDTPFMAKNIVGRKHAPLLDGMIAAGLIAYNPPQTMMLAPTRAGRAALEAYQLIHISMIEIRSNCPTIQEYGKCAAADDIDTACLECEWQTELPGTEQQSDSAIVADCPVTERCASQQTEAYATITVDDDIAPETMEALGEMIVAVDKAVKDGTLPKSKAKKARNRTANQLQLDGMIEAIIAATPLLDRSKLKGGAWSPYRTTAKWLLARDATPEDMAAFVPFVIAESNKQGWTYSVRCLTGKDRWPRFCGQRTALQQAQQQSEEDEPQPLSAIDGVVRSVNDD